MKKPIEPVRPKPPEILSDIREFDLQFSGPQKAYEEVLYETPTNLSLVIKDFKKSYPKASNEKLCELINKETYWGLYIEDDGEITIPGGGNFDEGQPGNYSSESGSVNIEEILCKLTNEERSRVKVGGVSNYYGDFLYGPPGLKVSITRDNEKYKEQMKAYKPYKKELDKFLDDWYKWDKQKEKYEKYQEAQRLLKEIEQ